MFESIQVSGFLNNLGNSGPNSRSNIRQTLGPVLVFRKGWFS